MSDSVRGQSTVPWRKEPTRDQWYAYIAAWLGWTLDAFDFTVFLLRVIRYKIHAVENWMNFSAA